MGHKSYDFTESNSAVGHKSQCAVCPVSKPFKKKKQTSISDFNSF